MRFFFGRNTPNIAPAQKELTVPPTGMDHAKMLEWCLPGPGVHVLVGEEEEEEEGFHIPRKLLLYHSPKVCKELLAPKEDTIVLNNHTPDAFNHIYRWMVSDKLNVYSNMLAPIGEESATRIPTIEESLPKACTLLAEIYTLTIHLGIAGIQPIIIAEFEDIIDRAREYQHHTPIIPSTILRVHKNMQGYDSAMTNTNSNGNNNNPLWETMMTELVTAFCSKPAPTFESYEPVWQALPFLYTRIIKTMHEKQKESTHTTTIIRCPACGSEGAVEAEGSTGGNAVAVLGGGEKIADDGPSTSTSISYTQLVAATATTPTTSAAADNDGASAVSTNANAEAKAKHQKNHSDAPSTPTPTPPAPALQSPTTAEKEEEEEENTHQPRRPGPEEEVEIWAMMHTHTDTDTGDTAEDSSVLC